MEWQCFLITPTDRAWRSLRRFTWSGGTAGCLDGNGHEASTEIAVVPLIISPDGTYDIEQGADPAQRAPAHDDPRWPTVCERCGAPLPADAEWQVFHERIYVAEDGREFAIKTNSSHRAPAGAMWEAPWLNSDGITSEFFKRSGRSAPIMCMLPDGYQWCMDQVASNGPGWEVTGTAPNFTARPSILSPRYHGWLTDGMLSPDLEGRTYG
jgi:hypothetical protein